MRNYSYNPKIRDKKLQLEREKSPTVHGGSYSTTRWGRSRGRIVSDLLSMNMTLRSTQAKGAWSFRQPKNFQAIEELTRKFADRFEVEVIRLSNNHNHLHYHLRFPKGKKSFVKFIRALTAAIAIAITGVTRWTKALTKKFWDRRPFTRVIMNANEYGNYEAYLDINDLEATGVPRKVARWILRMRRWAWLGAVGPPPASPGNLA